MRVGELARRAGVTVRALRYYEALGLVVPSRLANGYRDYDRMSVRQVEEIRALTGLGLSVEDTRPFVECLASGHSTGDDCPASLAAYQRAVDQLSARITALAQRRDALAAHLEAAAGRAMPSFATDGAGPVAEEPSLPGEGGTAAQLSGMRMRPVTLAATDGSVVSLDALGSGRTVLYVYPLTGRPGVDLPQGWEAIPGARGCTAEACGFRDHHAELRSAGAARVYGLSSQASEYQGELASRLRLPFAMLSDQAFALRGMLGLPVFAAGGMILYRRLTMIVTAGVIEQVFYPVLAPERHAAQVLGWLRAHPAAQPLTTAEGRDEC
jgi:peroxiredoxin/DNA-binding transcriptional MerR regulator